MTTNSPTKPWSAEQHPRGHARNPGSFSDKAHSAPEADLLIEVDPEVLAEAMRAIEGHARKYARRYRFDDATREEIQQDTILDLLDQQKRKHMVDGHAYEPLRQPALINAATRAVASRFIDPNVHHTDLTARALLKKTVAFEEEALGRTVTARELKVLADDLRLKVFEPGRRPSEGFYLDSAVYSLDFEVGSSGTTTGDLLIYNKLDTPFAEDLSETAEVVDRLANGELTRSDVKRGAWNLLSAQSEKPVPHAASHSLSRKQARTATNVVTKRAGGVAQLARDWVSGEADPALGESLFAPFGDITLKQRDAVVEQLLRHPDYAEDLWRSAAAVAARPQPSAAPAAG